VSSRGGPASAPPPPRATARLQLHASFTLADAAAVVPYFAALGISHLYLSPVLTARRGSPHGYDVVDPAAINPELGGRTALEHLVAVLRRHGMGIVLDIVPNHMAADAEQNAWWRDVLARGRASPYASWFDIDWAAPEPSLRGKVLLPVLGRPYAEALAAGEIRVIRDAAGAGAGPEIAYFEHRFPLAAGSGADADTPEALHALLEAQHYRLAWWRTAADAINWRRFFDINGLVALRAERPDVFAATHGLILDLFAEGLIDGVRVDHVDGLVDPAAYCRRLRRALTARRSPRVRPYIVVEKIMAPGETLPAGWQVDGTTGYEFMSDVAALLHDPAGAAPLTRLWTDLAGDTADFAEVEHAARREILFRAFAADTARVVRALEVAVGSGPAARDLPPLALARALAAIAARFPAYRTYLVAGPASPADAALLDRALAAAPAGERDLPTRLRDLLVQPRKDPALRHARARFQQLTATLAAKAVEDTAFYRYGRLISRNEVGASPGLFALSPDEFHAACGARLAQTPHTLLATATHDHKRGEDVRARLAVLSEVPAAWATAVAGWRRANEGRRQALAHGPAPAPADELTLYQTLVGAWPAALHPTDEAGVKEFGDRVEAWQVKALREAKQRSDWAAPQVDYEDACGAFLAGMLADPVLRREIARFAARIGPAGTVNGLAQTLLRLTVPGVPDLYQGSEFWDETLVDPDNRRAVDFVAREAALATAAPLPGLIRSWRSGHVKQGLIARLLRVRVRHPRLFAAGRYGPLAAEGDRAGHVLAFLRTEGRVSLLVAVARLAKPLLGDSAVPSIDPAAWGNTRLALPAPDVGPWRNVLHASPPLEPGAPALGAVFGPLPVACWLADGER
jgi:(1->4)-alpha-D-glucan 1-alpha-D-glucosylmutase